MARRRRKPLNDPPRPGTASFQEGEMGPPTYHVPMPPVKSRGPLIPAGEWQTGEVGPPTAPGEWRAHCEREGILLPDRPLIPTTAEIGKLPRLARFAFAARCGRRVWPIVRTALHSHPEVAAEVAATLELAEQLATGRGEPKALAEAGQRVVRVTDQVANRTASWVPAVFSGVMTVFEAAHAPTDAVTGGVSGVALATDSAARAVTQVATVQTPLTRQLRCLRRDYDRLVYLARKHNWTDDTPVPPEVFGRMWPKDLTPDWAKESQPPAA